MFSSLASAARRPIAAADGFNSLLLANGQLKLAFTSQQERRRLVAPQYAPRPTSPCTHSRRAEMPSGYVQSTLTALAANAGSFALARKATREIKSTLQLFSLLAAPSFKLSEMKKVAAFFVANPERMIALVPPAFALQQETVVQRLYALLTLVGTEQAHALIVEHGLRSSTRFPSCSPSFPSC